MKIDTALKHYSHKVGLNFWHMEWCTKYRYQMMKRFEIKNLVAGSIRKAARAHNIKIHILNVLPEHVHLLVSLPKGMTDSRALMLLKGRSSYIIFCNRPHIRLRYPRGHFWSAGAFSVTVGYNDLDSMANYILNQEMHHGLAST